MSNIKKKISTLLLMLLTMAVLMTALGEGNIGALISAQGEMPAPMPTDAPITEAPDEAQLTAETAEAELPEAPSVEDGVLPAVTEAPEMTNEAEAAQETAPEAEGEAAAAQEASIIEETETQSISAAVLPMLEQDAYVSPYAFVPQGTVLYKNREHSEELGIVASDSLMLATELEKHEKKTLYDVYFDTDVSRREGSCMHAYVYTSELIRPDREQTEGYIAKKDSLHTARGERVFVAKVELAVELAEVEVVPAEAEAPADELAEEPNEEAVEAPMEAPADEPMEVPADEPMEVPADEPMEAPADEPMEAPMDEPMEAPVDEPMEAPADEPMEAPVADGMEVPVDAPIEPTEAEAPVTRSVRVEMRCDTELVQLGSTITLTAKLEGYEGAAYGCCWQFAQADSEGKIVSEWQDSPQSELSLSYILSEDNVATAWRMCVTLL